jgi:DNA-binding response OmpR family regulator
MAKILLVEDDAAVVLTLSEWLTIEQHKVDAARTGDEAIDYIKAFAYDLLILDWQLPGISGLDICKYYRNRSKGPVLMLTGLSDVAHRVEGLDAGADDYLTKPFHMPELLARVRALIRRAADNRGDQIKAGDLLVDLRSHVVKKSGREITLTPREYEVLEFFLKHPNEVISPEMLLKRVWSSDADVSVQSVYACMNRLRKNLDAADKEGVIKTVHGVGYRLDF